MEGKLIINGVKISLQGAKRKIQRRKDSLRLIKLSPPKADEIKSKSSTRHKSLGLKITEDRIAILGASAMTESSITINDLVHPDGSAAGTEVNIKIPLVYD